MGLTKPLRIDTSRPVLVTGATGYVAGVLIEHLLKLGVPVHATIRDDTTTPTATKQKFQYLEEAARHYKNGSIQFFSADLLQKGSYDEAAKGCSIIFHTASPFVLQVKNVQRDLIDPAVLGTENVLSTANATDTVTRVVLTSSVAAIYGNASEIADTPEHIFNETIWNKTSNEKNNPYCYSKTLAEQKAWEMAHQQQRWKLVCINPSLVMGPGLTYHPHSQSYQVFQQLVGGDMKSGAPKLPFGVVDVRDVADAHIAAAFLSTTTTTTTTSSPPRRYIVSGTDTNFVEMGQAVAKQYGPPQYPSVPTKPSAVPKFLFVIVAPYVSPLSRQYVSENLNWTIRHDTSKSQQGLGLQYRPLEETLQDMFKQLLDLGIVKARA